MAKDKKDTMTIRAGSIEKRDEFKKRFKNLKPKGYTQADIVEVGLITLESGNKEQQLLNKREKAIAERDELIKEIITKNKLIEAYNRQLKDQYANRYKDHAIDKDVKIMYDSEGNEILY